MYNESGVTLNGAQYEGYIEVLRDGTWGSVCGFDSLEAAVVCRQLFPVGGYAQYNSRYSREGADAATKPVWMYDIKCQGDEASLLDCQYQDAQAAGKTACSEEEYYAYIKCSPDKGTSAWHALGDIHSLVYYLGHGMPVSGVQPMVLQDATHGGSPHAMQQVLCVEPAVRCGPWHLPCQNCLAAAAARALKVLGCQTRCRKQHR